MPIRSAEWTAFLMVAVLGLLVLTPLTASAEPIIFTFTGDSGSGSVGGIPFSNRPFTITAIGDTLNRQSITGGYFINNDAASIAIGGVGLFTFVTPTRTFFNDYSNTPGFSRAGSSGLDLYYGPSGTIHGWHMASSIGPVSGQSLLLQWTAGWPPVITSGGQLNFRSFVTTTGTFQAVGPATEAPEPSTVTLFGIAGLLMVTGHVVRRRRRELSPSPKPEFAT